MTDYKTIGKDNNPLVTVISICLNQETFVKEAIESVLAQTYKNWELMFVDDGSTDKTVEIAKDYAARFPEKIMYLEHEGHQNRGMSASRNLGISRAGGEYISFLDSDDIWFPHKLEQHLVKIQSNPEAAMVCSTAQYWYSWTGKSEDRQRDFVQRFPIEPDTLVEAPGLFKMFMKDNHATLCDVLVRKEIVDEVGGFEDSFCGLYEDMVFHSKICLKYPVYVSGGCWYRYRQHPGSYTHKFFQSEDQRKARGVFLSWLEHYLSKENLIISDAIKLVEKEVWANKNPKLAYYRDRLNLKRILGKITKIILPKRTNEWLQNQLQYQHWPPVGWVNFGSLRRLTPVGSIWTNRGRTIDRYYIQEFLSDRRTDIQGHVLEIADATYTWQFGGDRVTKSSVLHATLGNPEATIVGEIEDENLIPTDTFDCIILTQTILLIYDLRASIEAVYRILKPGGVVLLTVPGISQIVLEKDDEWPDYWRFTDKSAKRLMEEVFPSKCVQVGTYGNVLSATGFLYGLAEQELKKSELDHYDSKFQVTIWIRAQKPRV